MQEHLEKKSFSENHLWSPDLAVQTDPFEERTQKHKVTQYYFMNRMGLPLLIVKGNKKTNKIIFIQTLKKWVDEYTNAKTDKT